MFWGCQASLLSFRHFLMCYIMFHLELLKFAPFKSSMFCSFPSRHEPSSSKKTGPQHQRKCWVLIHTLSVSCESIYQSISSDLWNLCLLLIFSQFYWDVIVRIHLIYCLLHIDSWPMHWDFRSYLHLYIQLLAPNPSTSSHLFNHSVLSASSR